MCKPWPSPSASLLSLSIWFKVQCGDPYCAKNDFLNPYGQQHEESRFTEHQEKTFSKGLFQKQKKKCTRIAEKPFYAYYDKPLTIKHTVKINRSCLKISNHHKYDEKTMQAKQKSKHFSIWDACHLNLC